MRFILIDGTNLFWRSYHGLKTDLSSGSGQNTWAVHGTIMSIARVIRRWDPKYLLCAFDAGPSVFRRDIFPGYKPAEPWGPEKESAHAQLRLVEMLLALFGVRVAQEPGVEADDIIARAVRQFAGKGVEILIVTGDKDMRQLVRSDVRVFSPRLGARAEERIWDEAAVYEKYGVEASQFAEYLALVGDPSDSVPGVKGIGPVKAAALLRDYGSLENAVLSGEKMLDGHLDEASMSYSLVWLDGTVASRLPDMLSFGWRPVEPGTEKANDLEAALQNLDLHQLADMWKNGTIWRENDCGGDLGETAGGAAGAGRGLDVPTEHPSSGEAGEGDPSSAVG